MKKKIVYTEHFAKIELTQGYWAEIDFCDVDTVSENSWHVIKTKFGVYAATKEKLPDGRRTSVYMHRKIMKPSAGMEVDHKDHNGLNNRRGNLRVCTRSQNQMNTRILTNNKSGLKGAYWCQTRGRWLSAINLNGKGKFLGYFDTKEEAHEMYVKYAKGRSLEFFCEG